MHPTEITERVGGGPLVLGRYRLERRLGQGAFATVWLARDERLEREVAVKLLARERVVGGRFEREARAAARLTHPGIVTLYEAAVDDDGAYLVSELVRGATLAQLLRDGRLSDRDIVEIGIALCDALAHAHSQGVIHRDVKPSNVLVPERATAATQHAKLTDFGVARLAGGDTLTNAGEVIGTAAYMAPEQAEGLEAGVAADLYSLALVLYEALTGVNPLRTSAAAQRSRRLGAHLPPLRRQRRDLPADLGQAIDLALRPRPRERGSLADLRKALVRSLDGVEDRTGIVAGSWDSSRLTLPWATARTREDDQISVRRIAPTALAPEETLADAQPSERQPFDLPARARAAAAAAIAGAWLAGSVLAPGSLSPLVAALLGAIAVAVLPRLGWALLVGSLAVALALQGRSGATLALVVSAGIPPLLLARSSTRWPLAAFAPALGAVGLAGAWPALAARASTAWERAALGASGWLWVQAAAVLGGTGYYTHDLPAALPRSSWLPSANALVTLVVVPLLHSGLLAPALVWAAAAALAPHVVRSRRPAPRLIGSAIWSIAVVAATAVALSSGQGAATLPAWQVIVGGLAAAAIVFVPGAAIRNASADAPVRRAGRTRVA